MQSESSDLPQTTSVDLGGDSQPLTQVHGVSTVRGGLSEPVTSAIGQLHGGAVCAEGGGTLHDDGLSQLSPKKRRTSEQISPLKIYCREEPLQQAQPPMDFEALFPSLGSFVLPLTPDFDEKEIPFEPKQFTPNPEQLKLKPFAELPDCSDFYPDDSYRPPFGYTESPSGKIQVLHEPSIVHHFEKPEYAVTCEEKKPYYKVCRNVKSGFVNVWMEMHNYVYIRFYLQFQFMDKVYYNWHKYHNTVVMCFFRYMLMQSLLDQKTVGLLPFDRIPFGYMQYDKMKKEDKQCFEYFVTDHYLCSEHLKHITASFKSFDLMHLISFPQTPHDGLHRFHFSMANSIMRDFLKLRTVNMGDLPMTDHGFNYRANLTRLNRFIYESAFFKRMFLDMMNAKIINYQIFDKDGRNWMHHHMPRELTPDIFRPFNLRSVFPKFQFLKETSDRLHFIVCVPNCCDTFFQIGFKTNLHDFFYAYPFNELRRLKQRLYYTQEIVVNNNFDYTLRSALIDHIFEKFKEYIQNCIKTTERNFFFNCESRFYNNLLKSKLVDVVPTTQRHLLLNGDKRNVEFTQISCTHPTHIYQCNRCYLDVQKYISLRSNSVKNIDRPIDINYYKTDIQKCIKGGGNNSLMYDSNGMHFQYAVYFNVRTFLLKVCDPKYEPFQHFLKTLNHSLKSEGHHLIANSYDRRELFKLGLTGKDPITECFVPLPRLMEIEIDHFELNQDVLTYSEFYDYHIEESVKSRSVAITV